MTKIEKIQNIMEDDKIKSVMMSISNGEEITEAEIYLAFVDTITNKRYVVYTSEKAQNEDDRIPFTLSTLRLEENGYVLEETSKEDHQNIELPVLNIIGLNSDKDPEQVFKMINDKFPGVGILSLQVLKQNVDNITISEIKPPKKANMPIAIANVIKKFYLYQLNKEIKKVYDATEMSVEDKEASIEKLDEIEDKLDSIKEVYEDNAEKRGGPTSKIEKSLNQIEIAKKDIEAAKNRIQNLPEEYEEKIELENQVETNEDQTIEPEEIDQQENLEQPIKETEETVEPKEISSEEIEQPVEETVETEETNLSLEEPTLEPVSPEEQISVQEVFNENQEDSEKSIQQQVASIIEESMVLFTTNFEILIHDLSNGICSIYEKELKKSAELNQALKQQLYVQEETNKKEKQEMLEQITQLGQKANEVNQQALHSKQTIENLNQQLTASKESEQALKQENAELQGEVTSQKQLLDQQNTLIDSIREESKNRDEQQQNEIGTLKQENARLKIYEEEYNKIAGMFTNKPVDPQQQLIEEAVEHALNQR